MYPEEISAFDDSFAQLTLLTAVPPKKPTQPLAPAHAEAITQVLERWPASQRFPGMSPNLESVSSLDHSDAVIDLARLLVGYCPEMFQNGDAKEQFYKVLFEAADWNSPLPKIRETNTLLVLRAMVNAFQEGTKADEPWVRQVRYLSLVQVLVLRGPICRYYIQFPKCSIPLWEKTNGWP
jgi:phospholipase A-2-activating protein